MGLVIVDEEQRFGVAQKERLKELRNNVDVLTLSATPIPRTLHMSMVGVRDMSVIETPPEDRFPIRTYVVEYDEELIREAIMREIGRQGQVYFVYNQVQTIDRMASRLMDLVPEARIAVAHGQMDEDDLERVMLDFLHGEYDILLCSTIIETGMDISNVNTLIVYDADRLGLAQLYQLRGRVGRSNRVAYAYFTYRRDKVLARTPKSACRRSRSLPIWAPALRSPCATLRSAAQGTSSAPSSTALSPPSDLSSTAACSTSRSGSLKAKSMARPPDPVIDLNVDAYISEEYVTDSQQKVEIYKKVAATGTLDEVRDLEDEIRDRFGEPPQSVYNLLSVAQDQDLGAPGRCRFDLHGAGRRQRQALGRAYPCPGRPVAHPPIPGTG